MSERWISTPKHYCTHCKLWIRNTPHQIKTHEADPRHRKNVDRKIRNMQQDARSQNREEEMKGVEMDVLEDAACEKYARDIGRDVESVRREMRMKREQLRMAQAQAQGAGKDGPPSIPQYKKPAAVQPAAPQYIPHENDKFIDVSTAYIEPAPIDETTGIGEWVEMSEQEIAQNEPKVNIKAERSDYNNRHHDKKPNLEELMNDEDAEEAEELTAKNFTFKPKVLNIEQDEEPKPKQVAFKKRKGADAPSRNIKQKS